MRSTEILTDHQSCELDGSFWTVGVPLGPYDSDGTYARAPDDPPHLPAGPHERAEDRVDAIVVVGAARTAIGRFGGVLAGVDAVTLGASAIAGARDRSGVTAASIDRVLMGHVLQAGAGQNPARQAAVAAGLGMGTPAETLNSVCLSGMSAIAHGRDLLRLGEADVVVAGGMESMSNAPHLLDRSRSGYRYGHGTLIDVLLHDGLTCAFDRCSMGEATERHQADLGIDRTAQDEWAARSHARAAAASADGTAAAEIVPVQVPERGGAVSVTHDEGVRPGTDVTALAALRPAFDDAGTITAGNASQLSDGAAALVLTTERVAREQGLPVRGRLLAAATVAGPDTSLLLRPSDAVEVAARRAGLEPAGLDRYEINEAFASVALASTRTLGIDPDRVNVHGGAIALGHPLGCSGARIVVTLLEALHRAGGGRGAAALCGGGGQGQALIVEVDG
jgi:acetyl-CoA C-acetyltransferase